jgi:hypothetical protein
MGFVLYRHTNEWLWANERGSKIPLGFSAHFVFVFSIFSSPSIISNLLFFEFYYRRHYLMPFVLPSFSYSSSLPLLPSMSPSFFHSSTFPFLCSTSPSFSQYLNFFPRISFHWWHSHMCTHMINDTISCSRKLFVKGAHFKP